MGMKRLRRRKRFHVYTRNDDEVALICEQLSLELVQIHSEC